MTNPRPALPSANVFPGRDPHAAAKAHSNTAESWNATFKRAIAGVSLDQAS
jgi:hypothetical protein